MVQFKKENIARLFISLCISVFIWGYVTNMYDPIQTKTISNVPIVINNLEVLNSQNLALDSSSNYSVNVVVEGRYSDIQNVSNKDISAVVDLKDLAVKEGTNNILLTISSLNSKIEIVEKKTSLQTKIELVKVVQKEIPITVNVIGELKNNYLAEEPILAKDKIICSGTKDALNDVKNIVATIDVSNLEQTVEKIVELKILNKVGEEINTVNIKDKEISVTIPIKYIKEVPIKLKTKNNLPYGYNLAKYTLDKTSISIVGDKSVVDTIDYIETESIDLSRRYYDFDKRLNLVFPEGITSKNNTAFIYGSFEITKK